MTTAELRLQTAPMEEILADPCLRDTLLALLSPPGGWDRCVFCGAITRSNVCIAHQDLVQ